MYDEIAYGIVFLLSNEASFSVGATLVLDGGQVVVMFLCEFGNL